MIDTDKYEGHTPAPWAVFTSGDIDDIYMVDNRAVCDKDGKTIATIECPYCKEDEHLSYNNKILIADAPLLLEEVKRLRELLGETEYRLDMAEDVLGRSDWYTIYREIIDEDGGEE